MISAWHWFSEDCAREANDRLKETLDNDTKLKNDLYKCAHNNNQKRIVDTIVSGYQSHMNSSTGSFFDRVDRVLADRNLKLIEYMDKTRGFMCLCVADDNLVRKAATEHVKSLASRPDGCIKSIDGADMRGADLSSCRLSHIGFFCTNLSGADLRNTDMTGAMFSEVDLRNVKLNGPELVGACFSKVLADKHTASLITTYAESVKDLRTESAPTQSFIHVLQENAKKLYQQNKNVENDGMGL